MTDIHRITDFVGPIPNTHTKGVRFGLRNDEGSDFAFFAEIGIAEQLTASFVDAVNILSEALRAENAWVKVPTIQSPERLQVQRDELSGQVVITITMPHDVPRRLSLPPENAKAVARLLEAASQDHPPEAPN